MAERYKKTASGWSARRPGVEDPDATLVIRGPEGLFMAQNGWNLLLWWSGRLRSSLVRFSRAGD